MQLVKTVFSYRTGVGVKEDGHKDIPEGTWHPGASQFRRVWLMRSTRLLGCEMRITSGIEVRGRKIALAANQDRSRHLCISTTIHAAVDM